VIGWRPAQKTTLSHDTLSHRSPGAIEKDHNEKRALQIISEAVVHYGVDQLALRKTIRNDCWRVAIAKETTVFQAWIADHLGLSSAANANQQIIKWVKPRDVA